MHFITNKKDSVILIMFFILMLVSIATRFNREMMEYKNVDLPMESFLSH